MGILPQSDHKSNPILNKSKIPDYARDYKNEYLFIRAINKTCEDFIKRIDLYEENKIFNSSRANNLMFHFNKFLKAIQLDYLKDISDFYFKEKDVRSIESLGCCLDDYTDLYCDYDSFEFDQEKFDNNVENDYPGLKKFIECFNRFHDKLKVDYFSEKDFKSFLDSDSDDGVDRDDIAGILGSDSDSDSDSD